MYRQVTRTFVYEDKPVCEVNILNFAAGTEEILKVTSDHPIYLKNEGWIPARQLKFGKVVKNTIFGDSVVGKMIDSQERARVYNFEVDEFHTYFVGEVGTWVHNTCGELKLLPPLREITLISQYLYSGIPNSKILLEGTLIRILAR